MGCFTHHTNREKPCICLFSKSQSHLNRSSASWGRETTTRDWGSPSSCWSPVTRGSASCTGASTYSRAWRASCASPTSEHTHHLMLRTLHLLCLKFWLYCDLIKDIPNKNHLPFQDYVFVRTRFFVAFPPWFELSRLYFMPLKKTNWNVRAWIFQVILG